MEINAGISETSRDTPPEVLLIDEESKGRSLLAAWLNQSGLNVTTANTAKQAYQAATVNNPHVIVSETRSTSLDGLTLCRQFRSSRGLLHRVPFIFLSNDQSTKTQAMAATIGAADYITKPAYLNDIVKRVHAQVSQQSDPTKNSLHHPHDGSTLLAKNTKQTPPTLKVHHPTPETRPKTHALSAAIPSEAYNLTLGQIDESLLRDDPAMPEMDTLINLATQEESPPSQTKHRPLQTMLGLLAVAVLLFSVWFSVR